MVRALDKDNKPIIVARLGVISPNARSLKVLYKGWLDLWQEAKESYVRDFLSNFIETVRTAKGRIPYPETQKITRVVAKVVGKPQSHPLVRSITWDLKTRTRLFIYRKNFWGKDVPIEQFFTRPPKAIPLSMSEVRIEKDRRHKFVAVAEWEGYEITGKGTTYLKRRIRQGYIPYNGGMSAMLVFPHNRDPLKGSELHILMINEQNIPSYTPRNVLSIDLNADHVSVLIPNLGPVFFSHNLSEYPTTSSQYDYRLKKLLSLITNIAKETQSYVVLENLREADFVVRDESDAAVISRTVKLPFVMLEKKLQSEVIYRIKVDPTGTSATCPIHGVPMKKVSSKWFECPIGGELWHRDVAAVYNIALKGKKKLPILDCPSCDDPEERPVVLLEDQWLYTSWREVLKEIERRRELMKNHTAAKEGSVVRGSMRQAPCSQST